MRALRFLAAALAVLLLAAAPAHGPALPIDGLAAAQSAATQLRIMQPCRPGMPVVEMLLRIGGQEFGLLTDGDRFLLFDNAPGDETDVWIGAVVDGQFEQPLYMTFKALTERYRNVCEALAPRSAA